MKTKLWITRIITAITLVFGLNNANAQDLLCSWHFDGLLAAPNTITSVPADSGQQDGTAYIYFDGTNGSSTWITATTGNEVSAFTGSTLNDGRLVTAATMSLCPLNTTANGKSFVMKFDMTNHENPILTFATRGTGTGFSSHIFEYSVDGVSFTRFDTVASNVTSTWAIETIDLTTYDALDGVAAAYIRIIFDGATSSSGNNRMDNVTINATSTSLIDITPPVVVNVWALDLNTVQVKYSEAMRDTSAEFINHYTGLAGIASAVLNSGLDTVTLNLSTPLVFGVPDTICIADVRDTTGNLMAISQCFPVQYGVIDVTPPTAVSAWPADLATVKVKFSEALDQTTAETLANYTGLAGIATATLNSTLDTVTLALSTHLISGVSDTLYVNNVEDIANNPMASQQMFVLMLDTSTTTKALVITEIMYNSPEGGLDSLEFIEIYNNDVVAIDLMNYKLMYGTSSYTFATSNILNAGSYVLIAPNATEATNFYGVTFIQGASNGISNSGTFVKIVSPSGLLVDSVNYLPTAPWPTAANAGGPSLTLCNPNSDNNDAANWSVSTHYIGTIDGTTAVFADPGTSCVITSINKSESGIISLYPNPAGEYLKIEGLESASTIDIYNNMGMLVSSFVHRGEESITIETATMQNGLYYVSIHMNDGSLNSKSFVILN